MENRDNADVTSIDALPIADTAVNVIREIYDSFLGSLRHRNPVTIVFTFSMGIACIFAVLAVVVMVIAAISGRPDIAAEALDSFLFLSVAIIIIVLLGTIVLQRMKNEYDLKSRSVYVQRAKSQGEHGYG